MLYTLMQKCLHKTIRSLILIHQDIVRNDKMDELKVTSPTQYAPIYSLFVETKCMTHANATWSG